MRSNFAIFSLLLGNLFEHYDTALFGVLSPFLAPLFFPEHDPFTALLLTYGIIPISLISKPLGSIFFGRMGDVYGREKILFLNLMGMGIVSLLMGLCPSYEIAGGFAPILLCLGRCLQSFLSAGETMGGAVYLLEKSSEKNHDLLASCYSATTVGGILAASLAVSTLCLWNQVETSWRILYFLGSGTAFFGCFLRGSGSPIALPDTKKMGTIFWECRAPLALIALAAGFSYAHYSMSLVFINGFIPLVSSYSKEDMANLNLLMLLIDFVALPFFGWISSKVSRELLMVGAAFGTALVVIPLFSLLEGPSFFTLFVVRTIFILLGVAFFAPFHAWCQNLIPPSYRSMVISFGYAFGTQLLGGPTSIISIWTYQKTGLLSSVTWYWMTLAFLTGWALLKSRTAPRLVNV